jgi:hypothetical protein
VVNHYKPRGSTWCNLTLIPFMTWLPRSSRLSPVFKSQQRNRTLLHLVVLATMRSALDLVSHQVPRTKPTCLSTPRDHTGIDLSRLFFTSTNANQAATYTCNTRPRVSPQNVVNHSSQGTTDHRSSDTHKSSMSPLGECIDNTHIR